ncbi:CaiB/BaiF CoA transferase family protein [Acuticoccus kandeliae]|uniref:CaiB/BaiF CoA transferase family protein n=1 Tax=Acuticoccus kandeliae TaxID=2073160 RepID=UPI00196AE9F0|nr:CaiB/BaiF CoA-transferase family protein [Acuticoccus kandeliae]
MKTEDTAPTGPLAGIRVLDLTHMLSGPYCTWVLGALGAEIIKVERPGAGDFTRIIAPFFEDASLYFTSVNRHKRSLTLNLKSPAGQDVFRALVARSDVLVENNRAGVMDRLGLGYEAMKAVNPRLVYASISGFGQDGPYRDKPAFDVIAQALSGMMSITGEPDGGPCRVGTSIGDIGASLFTVIGILAAIESRHRTGEGTHLDVAMLDCQLALMENAVARVLNVGETPGRLGSRHPLVAPFQVFATADRPIAICVDTNAQWERMCGALGVEALVADPRFVDGSARNAHHSALEPMLQAVLSTRPQAEWLERLEAADVPVSRVNTVAEALEDPQVKHRAMVEPVAPGSDGRFVGLPIKMRGHHVPPTGAPTLGGDSDAILRELGYGASDVDRLRAEGAV